MEAPVCSHNQRGHCKWGQTCQKHHIHALCPSLSTCKDKLCKMRHHITCRNLALDGFCRFGELYSYSHRIKQSPSEAVLNSELKYLYEAIIEINIKLEVLQAEVLNVKNKQKLYNLRLWKKSKQNVKHVIMKCQRKEKYLKMKLLN